MKTTIIASVRDLRLGVRLHASADISANQAGDAWLNVNVRNNQGMTTQACLELNMDSKETPTTNAYQAVRRAMEIIYDPMHDNVVLADYTLDAIVSRVERRGGIYAANAANVLADRLAYQVVNNLATAIDQGNTLVREAARSNDLRRAFAALAE